MTIWTPDLSRSTGPKYRRLADALIRAISDGELAPGTRLPTQRELAIRLGVTVGTVGRAYDEVRERGLISGEVGRGTFVRDGRPEELWESDPFHLETTESETIHLALDLPVRGELEAQLSECLSRFAKRPGAAWIYHPSGGTAPQLRAASAWIAETAGLDVASDEIVITNGAQQAVLVALSSTATSGDVVLSANLVYPGMTAAARWLGLKLEGVALDESGLVPAALEEACRRHRPRVLYCLPTLQNPTGATMPEERRQAILDLAIAHDLAIVEDDTYRFLAPDAPAPIASRGRGRVWYLTTLSKSVSPGLRIGFLCPPADESARARSAVMATTWTAPPLTAELARAWVEDGTARTAAVWRLEEAKRRRQIARRHLDDFVDLDHSEHALQLWISTPEPWRAADFVDAARRRGVLVTSPEPFVVGRAPAPHAVRVCLGSPPDDASLERGLKIVAELLRDGEGGRAEVI